MDGLEEADDSDEEDVESEARDEDLLDLLETFVLFVPPLEESDIIVLDDVFLVSLSAAEVNVFFMTCCLDWMDSVSLELETEMVCWSVQVSEKKKI